MTAGERTATWLGLFAGTVGWPTIRHPPANSARAGSGAWRTPPARSSPTRRSHEASELERGDKREERQQGCRQHEPCTYLQGSDEARRHGRQYYKRSNPYQKSSCAPMALRDPAPSNPLGSSPNAGRTPVFRHRGALRPSTCGVGSSQLTGHLRAGTARRVRAMASRCNRRLPAAGRRGARWRAHCWVRR